MSEGSLRLEVLGVGFRGRGDAGVLGRKRRILSGGDVFKLVFEGFIGFLRVIFFS